MTDKEKLEKLKKLADAMYYAAQQLTTDASRLHKAMDEYYKFIINEYHKEEPEYLEEETKYCAFSTSHYTDKERKALCKGCEEECKFNQKKVLISENLLQASIAYADAHSEYCTDKKGRVVEHYNIRAKEHFIAGANWQKEQLLAKESMSCVLEWYDGFVLNFTEEQLNDVITKNNINIDDKVKVIVIKEG